MLIVKLINVGGTNEAASYKASVFVNTRQIWQGSVSGHNRDDGWIELIRKLAETAGTQNAVSRGLLEGTLDMQDPDYATPKCPICKGPVTVKKPK